MADTSSTQHLSQQKVLLHTLLDSVANGTGVKMKYFHNRDRDTIREAVGAIAKIADDEWVMKVAQDKILKFPNGDVTIFSAESLNRQPSTDVMRIADDESTTMGTTMLGESEQLSQRVRASSPSILENQRRPQQPGTRDEFDDPAFLRRIIAVLSNTRASPIQQAVAAPTKSSQNAITPGSDLQTFLIIGDALRGQDTPTWRLCSGVLLHRSVQPMFLIVSIPHLIFQEDEATNMMTKRPKGKALELYSSLAHVKMQYPNQAITKYATKQHEGKKTAPHGHQPILAVDASIGVRADLERSERMFVTLLGQLDQVDQHELPSSKKDWLLFLDAGVSVLSCYATLANGFIHGGAKISASYNRAIVKGKFDPAALWAETEAEFRKKE
jgi:hypothetical protein